MGGDPHPPRREFFPHAPERRRHRRPAAPAITALLAKAGEAAVAAWEKETGPEGARDPGGYRGR